MANKKNILFILHLPPPVHGSSMVGLSIKNSDLINNSFECSYINLLVSRNLNETGKFGFLKILRLIGVWYELLMAIIKKKPEVCYLALSTTGLSFYKDVLLVFLLRIFRVKLLYHLHNKGVRYSHRNKINSFFYRFVFKDANIILLSNKLYKDIEDFVPKSKVYICPNGIEDPTLNFNHKLFTAENPVKIIFLSNLIESKGVSVLLDACAILQQKGISFECDFVGAEGDIHSSEFDNKVRICELSNKVNYLGKKFGKEKQKLLEDAEIFAFPTYYSNECFPLVILEAMSAGLPVISTFEGGIPDIVEEEITGFLIPQKKSEPLAEKLEILIKNPELRNQMGKAGRLKFEREFTIKKFELKLVEILQHIVDI
jgi:glycosyltransferase involved in cell wall biosynthesis